METLNQQVLTDERALTPTVRDVLAIGYRPPKDRSLAPTQVKSNQGCPCKNLTKCWPTIPVAPRTPTSIF